MHRGKQGFVMPLSEWLAGRLQGELDEHLGPRGLAARGLFRDGALARLLDEHRSRPPQSRRPPVDAADPRALAAPLRAVVVARVKPLSILHTESSIGWGGQELRILTEMEGMAARGHRVHLVTAGSADILPGRAGAGTAGGRPADRSEEAPGPARDARAGSRGMGGRST